MKMKKAIKIDVVKKTVYQIELSDDYKAIYGAIGNGCTIFCAPIEFENGDTLYSDEEGLLHEKMEGCFMMPNWKSPLVGNAIILGTDDEGDSIDAKSTIEEIESKIHFYDEQVAENWKQKALNTPPQIITFN